MNKSLLLLLAAFPMIAAAADPAPVAPAVDPVVITPLMVSDANTTLSADEVVSAIHELSLADPENTNVAVSFADFIDRNAADLLAGTFKKYGHPMGVIVGTEGAGSFVVGYRKGAGRALFKGQDAQDARKIYWRGPNVGPSFGGSTGRMIALIYNSMNYSELLQDFVGANGSLYFVGGVGISAYTGSGKTLVIFDAGGGYAIKADLETLRFTDDEEYFPVFNVGF